MSRSLYRHLSSPAGMTEEERIEAEDFGRRLAVLLAERRMKQSDFARMIWGEKVDKKGRKSANGRDKISAYINGRDRPSKEVLQEMAGALGMTPEEMAPDIAVETAAREPTAYSFTTPRGRTDLTRVRVDMLIPSELSSELMIILNKARKAGIPS